jgi:phosphoribosyl 1,2-cyclic phosphodiesterase
MSVQFAVLASGSRGNATLLHGASGGLLIDIGLGPRVLAHRLESVASSLDRVSAAILTHTHRDHVDPATLGLLARRGILLYCHPEHANHLRREPAFEQLRESGLVRNYDEAPFLTPSGFRVEPIPVFHDGGPTFGFRIEASARRAGSRISIGYLADSGSWTDATADCLVDVDALGVEFNHDISMQRGSSRSSALIARILGDRGHLSNEQGSAFVKAVLARSHPRSLRHLVLLHLSRECNHPDLAMRVAESALRTLGRRAAVHAARQEPAFPNIWIAGRKRTLVRPGARLSAPAPAAPAQLTETHGFLFS